MLRYGGLDVFEFLAGPRLVAKPAGTGGPAEAIVGVWLVRTSGSGDVEVTDAEQVLLGAGKVTFCGSHVRSVALGELGCVGEQVVFGRCDGGGGGGGGEGGEEGGEQKGRCVYS